MRKLHSTMNIARALALVLALFAGGNALAGGE